MTTEPSLPLSSFLITFRGTRGQVVITFSSLPPFNRKESTGPEDQQNRRKEQEAFACRSLSPRGQPMLWPCPAADLQQLIFLKVLLGGCQRNLEGWPLAHSHTEEVGGVGKVFSPQGSQLN